MPESSLSLASCLIFFYVRRMLANCDLWFTWSVGNLRSGGGSGGSCGGAGSGGSCGGAGGRGISWDAPLLTDCSIFLFIEKA